MMRKPHKHADLIKAWADGAEIQYKMSEYLASDVWIDTHQPVWESNNEYRVKPKTVKYRLYLYKGWASHTIRVGIQESPYDSDKSNSEGFIRWLGDWQEVEV
jgi:hypothetical protein